MKIDILLSTYNGEKYLHEQLDSLLNQDYKNISILIRDDGSTDTSLKIIADYIDQYPSIIKLIKSEGNLGSTKSFYRLLTVSSSPFIMFCDQDDVWLPNKVSISLDFMLLNNNDLNQPLLVFTDLLLVDEHLQSLHKTVIKSQKMGAHYLSKEYSRLLVQNPIAGCTILLNKKAVDKVLSFGEFPQRLVHDHWIGVIVARFGKVLFLDETTLLYRQHSANQIGNAEFSMNYVYSKIQSIDRTIKHDLYFIRKLGGLTIFNFCKLVVLKIYLNLKRIMF